MRRSPSRYGAAVVSFAAVAAVAAVAAGAGDGPGPARAARLNVLLVTADDLGLQLSAYGEERIATPHLDALAQGGTLFEVAYASQASCSPSRSTILTGLYPHATGQYGLVNARAGFELHAHLRGRTLPALLKEHGFRTGVVGKLHVAPRELFPWDHRGPTDARDVREVAAEVERFLSANPDDEAAPFFLMVNFTDPHVFRMPGGRFGYERQVGGLPERPVEPSADTLFAFQGVDAPFQRRRVADYLSAVLRLDAGVGLLLGVLEEHGRADETLVLFCGDHGPPFARAKTTCYEAGLRVPFLVRWPGAAAGRRSRALVSTADIVPTVLDAVGIEPPAGLHGRSLRPLVQGEPNGDAPWREYLVGEYHFHGYKPFYPRRAIRDARYKLIRNLRAGDETPGTGIDGDRAIELARSEAYEGTPVRRAFETFAAPPEFELYDLERDPSELVNLSGQASVRAVEGRLKDALEAWRRRTSDPLLDPTFVEELIRRGERAERRATRTSTDSRRD